VGLGISRALGLGEENLRAVIEALAYQCHARQGSGAERQDVPADIPLREILAVLAPLTPENLNPQIVVNYLETRSGLLIGKQEGVYAFLHRSFQEYLAACYLAGDAEFAARLRELVLADPDWWREVCLLGIGKASQGGLGSAISALNTLLPDTPENTVDISENHWYLASLVGQAVIDLRLDDRAASQPHYQAIRRRALRWLVELLEGARLTPRERLRAGDVLGALGDPRQGVGVSVVSPGEPAVPDIEWVEIPAGAFTMGSDKDEEDAYGDEQPAHMIALERFYISRYPITNAQFRPFIEAGGYENPDYWTPPGWAWRQGSEADLSPIDDVDFKEDYRNWLSQRGVEKRSEPFWWHDPKWSASSRPVVGVCWYEALAYCRWLIGILPQSGLAPHDGQFKVQLPSEAEWEKAARGTDSRRWPWGSQWQEGLANTEEAGLVQTSPAGIFPAGASPYGVQDMAGNVWEWTRSRWGRNSIYRPDYEYPYDPADGREALDGPDLRVVRGGSWHGISRSARCANRLRHFPDFISSSIGFRVVVSLADSDS
jgi:formylglycine-generating enzyme required for sulfatase activity